jgi:hypothetical protein
LRVIHFTLQALDRRPWPAFFGYSTNYLTDVENAIIAIPLFASGQLQCTCAGDAQVHLAR